MRPKVSTRARLSNLREKYIDIFRTIDSYLPEMPRFLNYSNSFELLISVILSAQTTDKQVNAINQNLFSNFPDPESLSKGDLSDIEKIIHSTGFFKQKAKNIKETSKILHEKFDDKIPDNMGDLTSLPGVGRKTAGVILFQIYQKPAIIVDTHFKRLTLRTGLVKHEDPEKIEKEFALIAPSETWGVASMKFNAFAREICVARLPKCSICPIKKLCIFGTQNDSTKEI